jgi:hypothetical protein
VLSDLWQRWHAAEDAPLTAIPAALPDPATIPPREWLYGAFLVRRFVSVLAAPGGAGKSALAMGQAVALASGRPILGERVHQSAPAWIINLEDPLDELNRRLAACLRLHRLADAEIAGRVFLHSGRERRVCMAALDADGVSVTRPDQEAVTAAAREKGIGLIVVDPFVKSHALDENSNPHMDAAATAWAEVAEQTGAAVLLVHHVRKLGGATVDVEATRGAKALTDAARAAAVLAPMTPEEGERLAIPPAERWRYLRLDDAKANLAPRAEQARWFRLESIPLGNATALYPNGDTVGAIAAWKPPSPFADLDAARANAALDAIAAGPGEGLLYTATRGGFGNNERWAGRVLEGFGLTPGAAARVLAQWLRNGVLTEVEYRDPAQRRTRRGVRVNDAKRPTVSAGERKTDADGTRKDGAHDAA